MMHDTTMHLYGMVRPSSIYEMSFLVCKMFSDIARAYQVIQHNYFLQQGNLVMQRFTRPEYVSFIY